MTSAGAALAAVTLEDKYTKPAGRIFLTGIQALVRLPMLQRERDLAAGLDTAGYISGYRGSPLGGLDQQLVAARKHLAAHNVKFQPGVNEDLAATAIWGTQQAEMTGEGKYDGVFAIWYGKGPGVDRSGDAFRHGNLAGTSRHGGVLVFLGDDHTCESSTTAHQSEYAMVDAQIPVLNPAGVQELLDFGLHGWAMSRYSGAWVAMKCVHDTVNIAASIELDPSRVEVRVPDDFTLPPGGLNIRWPDDLKEQERRLHAWKLDAARAYARANRLDNLIWPNPEAKIGVVTTGKSYFDTRQALDALGIDDARANRLGLRLYKVGMSFPLDPVGLMRFAAGLGLVVVVEEKRGLIESQLKEILYGTANPPRVIGKKDEAGARLFFAGGALDPNHIAVTIGRRILARQQDPILKARVEAIEHLLTSPHAPSALERRPYFCAGCPHNTGTRVPDGSRASAGIGCSFMAAWMDRGIVGFTQMGAEGANWVGEAHFSTRKHIFQNIGDGTYYHSGLMAIRAAIASGVNITYKILYNDAVAMTGGQPMDGPLTVPQISQQVWAEGAMRVAVVSDEPQKYTIDAGFAPGVTIHHRDELDDVQRALAAIEGCTILIYDQTCAAEKRRRRKRGRFLDPAKRTVINAAVCEGCGDCGVQSNCVAVIPLETEFGRKRQIDQSSCNKDFSCVKGFCPSFVTVHGGRLRKGKADRAKSAIGAAPAEPVLPSLERPYAIAVTGVGGTGIVTIGALIGMAAHLEGKGCGILDMTGLAQKGGAVTSHLRIAKTPADIGTVRIPAGGADLLLGGDLVVSGGQETVATLRPGSHAIVNAYEMTTGDFTRMPDLALPVAALRQAIEKATGQGGVDFVDATRLATSLMGDAIASNLFLLGYAYQKGLVPVSAAAIERAIEINAAAVDMNKEAFQWGRRAANDRPAVERLAFGPLESPSFEGKTETLERLVARRIAFLTDYQDAAYAERYRALVERAHAAEALKTKGLTGLAEAIARYYFKLLAYKDEYEVARLYTDGDFLRQLREQFEGKYRLHLHLAPPLIAPRDPNTGELSKREYGSWILHVLRALASLRRLRGTVFDLFGYTAERRRERALIREYERVVEELIAGLDSENHKLAIEIASIPEQIRGFGHVKERNLVKAKAREGELLRYFRGVEPNTSAAAE